MTLRWPWVARSTLEAVVEERNWLRDERQRLIDHLVRMDRSEHGLAEVPREQKPPLTPMPAALRARIEAFGNPSLRKTMRDEAYRRHAAGQSWESIIADDEKDDEEEEDD